LWLYHYFGKFTTWYAYVDTLQEFSLGMWCGQGRETGYFGIGEFPKIFKDTLLVFNT
jgi:hypothetical protein